MGTNMFSNPYVFGPSSNMEDDIAHYRLREQYPTFEEDAQGGGWKPDGRGNYTRTYNGITQTLPESLLATQLQEQKQAIRDHAEKSRHAKASPRQSAERAGRR